MRQLIAIILITILIASPCYGATYTVCASGCDETTIQAVFDNNDLAPADVVEVQADTPGGSKTYSETVTPGSNDSGDSGDDVLLQSRSGDTITIDGGGVRATGIVLNNVDYFTVDGFSFDNMVQAATATAAVSSQSASSRTNQTVKNCIINVDLSGSANTRYGVLMGTPGSSSTAWGNRDYNITIENVTITTDIASVDEQTDTLKLSNIEGLIIDSCSITNSNSTATAEHNDGIQVWNVKDITLLNNYISMPIQRDFNQGVYLEFYNYGSDETPYDYGTMLVYNNLITGYGGSYLLQFFSRTGGGAVSATVEANVYNNTIDALHNSNAGSLPLRFKDIATIDCRNNILIARRTTSPRIAIATEYSGTTEDSLSLDYNYYYIPADSGGDIAEIDDVQITWAELTGLGYEANGIGYDSGWTDPGLDSEYKPLVGSGVIDVGVDLSSIFTVDKDEITRTVPWEMGAYKYVSGAPVYSIAGVKIQ